jgi:hypothetical protein
MDLTRRGEEMEKSEVAGWARRRNVAPARQWRRFWSRCTLGAQRPQHAAALALAVVAGMASLPATADASPAPLPCPNETLRTPPSSELPDCRSYEQVSPTDKDGFAAVPEGYPVQASPNGEAFMYTSLGAFSGGASSSLPNAYVAKRSGSGWVNTNVSPPTLEATPPGGDPVGYDFSTDLSQWVVNLPLQPLAAGATPGVLNLFLSGEVGGYSWINDVRPPIVPPEGCPGSILVYCYEIEDLAAFAGASADYHHILFEATPSLAGGAPEEEGLENLYESTDDAGTWHVSLVGILPDHTDADGSTAGAGSSVFYTTVQPQADGRVANAISEDGSQVVFQAKADGKEPDPAQSSITEVYDRLGGSETIELSAPAAGATPEITTPEPALFWAASANGTRVFFTSSAELTTHSYTGAVNPAGEDLYEYDTETRALKDLTIDTNRPADEAEGAAVQGVVGISSDGSYVYFVAKGQLVPGKGVDHGDNLYVVHNGGAPVFIAALNALDSTDWAARPIELESYVTANGTHLAFTSIDSLPTANFPSGYDNVDEQTSEAEREVYEYSTPSAEEESHGSTGSLICASCDPSAAPPIGPGVIGGGRRSTENGTSINTPFHQARAVSESGGRVFFSSQDPLVAAAAGNTRPKVYEYERDGEGSCKVADGCIYLLSSSASPASATFLDADREGTNVFLATVSPLTTSDQDKQVDVYDARVEGGFASPSSQASCDAGCREASVETSTSLAPLSGFGGASGNLAAPSKQPTTKTSRAKELAKALRTCRKEKGKRRRSCEARARKRYGPQRKSKQSSRNGKRGE